MALTSNGLGPWRLGGLCAGRPLMVEASADVQGRAESPALHIARLGCAAHTTAFAFFASCLGVLGPGGPFRLTPEARLVPSPCFPLPLVLLEWSYECPRHVHAHHVPGRRHCSHSVFIMSRRPCRSSPHLHVCSSLGLPLLLSFPCSPYVIILLSIHTRPP